ncbi:hypothetical protein M514_01397 [Trichuris suis]|uniref:GDP-fucose protein O-fucosyltransferase 2 n=1 Tax=Trichuris suis TaxID=68888 RepID=A0A085MKI1_9BILA|nr:hypothetical protein M513_01397 [Trichuris suis]KFD72188.1 hypothetical protein M514_01397 [Trichuris suis]
MVSLDRRIRLKTFAIFIATLCFSLSYAAQPTVSVIDPEKFSLAKERRYLLYEVNPGEGFNLRRDVYMRIASVVRGLRKRGHNFILVLPPWGASIHWQSSELGFQEKIPWKLWFDIDSLKRFVPKLEAQQSIQFYFSNTFTKGLLIGRKSTSIDLAYNITITKRRQAIGSSGFGDTTTFTRETFHAYPSKAMPEQLSVMIDRAEVMLHDNFGGKDYWDCRKSMRYSAELRAVADEYRAKELNSDDVSDGTSMDDDWTKMKVRPGQAKGGPYMAVHLRRRDFVTHRRNNTPTIQSAIGQIAAKAKENSLDVVFIATDGNKEEIRSLFDGLSSLGLIPKRFVPNRETLHTFLDGGISIIDQWICAHARYFLGSSESTFSLRIYDDREILGFDSSTTFNSFCGTDQQDCEQPAQWKLVQ